MTGAHLEKHGRSRQAPPQEAGRLRAAQELPAGAAGRLVQAPILIQTAHYGPDELAGVLPVIAPVRREPDAQRGGETFEIFDPGFVKAVDGELHARAAT